ncbi:MAG TPA: DNA polymerase/3'-5' exonuclease PolX [Gaiellaceae bacterium]|nr:DNA polymerase/3'-5' exonuclease PolX [Gaiellaceae bacterium]
MANAKTLPRNGDVADQFELLADMLELEGSDQFRPLAYRRAAQVMRETGGSIAQLAVEGRAKDLSGIGKTIEEKIVQIVEQGQIEALAQRQERIPADVVEFMRLPGLGPKTARRIWQELGVSTLGGLKQAAESEQLRTLSGLGAKTEEKVLRALARPAAKIERKPLLGLALPALRAVVSVLREHPAADQVSEAGSARRLKEQVRDLDIIATASDPAALTDYFTKLTWVQEVVAKGKTKATVVSNDALRFDLRVVPPDAYGNLLQHFTGSKAHNVALRENAVRRKLSVSEYGVQDVESGEVFTDRTEEALYERLGYAWIPPELRENMGELEAAREGRLPQLVDLGQLRGDLHAHTTWSSDGKNTIEEMALHARKLGHSYLAITDHSHYLRENRLEAQTRELEALQESLGRFRLLKGIEVNIRADGSLDVPDDVLAERDWVMASVHSGFDRDVTERVLAAMESPHVDCIGHLTGRKLNRRGPADIDFERIVAKAVETGTFLEINAQPDRLDLRDAHARLAGEAGVKITISSDAHELAALENLEFGVAQARRGWLGPDQIVNTRPWRDVKRLLKRS